ncbi:MAG: hypothetical protein ACXWV5_00495 [Flavitalea sp.]
MDNKYTFYRNWLAIAIINLLIVAIAGVIMRYKILFSLPFVEQKNLLHAHSHFAFSGWISLALCTLLLYVLSRHSSVDLKKYRRLFIFSQLSSFGMLFTFPFTGYGFLSIFFSTCYIIFSYLFTYTYIKDLKISTLSPEIKRWFKTGLWLWCISSLGAFALAAMMALKIQEQFLQIGSVYFFLHFQYNGWFIYAVIGLFIYAFAKKESKSDILFHILTWSIIPSYFLSTLWMEVPVWVNIIAVIAAITQLWAIKELWRFIPRYKELSGIKEVRWLIFLSIGFLFLKFLFQGFSAVPYLSEYAFGLRPIVIGFLHLVFLGCISLFIFGYGMHEQLINEKGPVKTGIILFISGVILNEVILFGQGLGAMFMYSVPYTKPALMIVSLLLLISTALIIKGNRKFI